MNIELNNALFNYLMDTKNPLYNFTLGKVYEDMGHTAAAATFYMRTGEFAADFENNELLAYEAILRLALCFEHQGSRVFTVKGLLLRAISLMPKRPEAYFLLSRIYEHCKEWQEGYTFAILGYELEEPKEKLITNVEYPGKYGFTFERAVTGWWLGLWDESIFLSRQLSKDPTLEYMYKEVTANNIRNLSAQVDWKPPIPYYNSLYEHLRYKFNGAINVEKNYSQCFQDIFVLSMLDGKRNGIFLEIGCADPYYGNNTALLEQSFGWNGISIDIDKNATDLFSQKRSAKTLCIDATKLNYKELLKEYKDIDYLQLDCDPAIATYNTLLQIPFDEHKFAVITFEHDHYHDEKSDIRNKSRKYLESLGYELIVSDIAPNDFNNYEDWWVHPDLVNPKIINIMKDISEKTKRADKYIFGRI